MKSFLPVLFLLPTTLAANSVKFTNHCPYPLYFWTVAPSGNNVASNDENRYTVPPNGGSLIHSMRDTEQLGGGMALKIRDYPSYKTSPAGIVQVEYYLKPSKGELWYDLSAVDCDHEAGPESAEFCPFIDGGIELYVPVAVYGQCPPAWCTDGQCVNTYDKHGSWQGEPTFKCWAGADLFFETCTERAGPQTFNGCEPHEAVVSGSELAVSRDGTCGGATGYTCTNSGFGTCCSQWGFCGTTSEYCGASCQTNFGICNASLPIPPPPV